MCGCKVVVLKKHACDNLRAVGLLLSLLTVWGRTFDCHGLLIFFVLSCYPNVSVMFVLQRTLHLRISVLQCMHVVASSRLSIGCLTSSITPHLCLPTPDTRFHLKLLAMVDEATNVCAGGAAGSLSLVTGSIGNTLAVLSFDKDYQKVSEYFALPQCIHFCIVLV